MLGSVASRKTLACWLSLLLFEAAIAGCEAKAQSGPVNGHRWLTCDVSWISSDYHPGPNFTVRVSFRGRPITGVKVSLTSQDPLPQGSSQHVVGTGDTDSNGVAHFFAIPPGKYIAHVDEGLLAQSDFVEVDAGNVDDQEVRIEWPSETIETRNVRGWIVSWQQSTPQNRRDLLPLQRVLVQLLDLRSGKLLASTYTDTNGLYEFAAPEGLYVLRVSEHPDPSVNGYDAAVEVDSDADLESMPGLEVDWDCGGVGEVRRSQ